MSERKRERRENISCTFADFTFAYEQVLNTKTGGLRVENVSVVDSFTSRRHPVNRLLLNQLSAQLNSADRDEALVFQPADHVNLHVSPDEVERFRDVVGFCLRIFRA